MGCRCTAGGFAVIPEQALQYSPFKVFLLFVVCWFWALDSNVSHDGIIQWVVDVLQVIGNPWASPTKLTLYRILCHWRGWVKFCKILGLILVATVLLLGTWQYWRLYLMTVLTYNYDSVMFFCLLVKENKIILDHVSVYVSKVFVSDFPCEV